MEKIVEVRRCSWCGFEVDKDNNILPKEIRDKYIDVDLPHTKCVGCLSVLLKENGF